jgi:hypothetical protein
MDRACGSRRGGNKNVADQAKPEPEPELDDRLVCVDDPESLEGLANIVETGLEDIAQRYVVIGEALAKIRDRKLYRQTDKTFPEYVLERFGLARSSAYDYIWAAAEAKETSGAPDILPPPTINAALTRKKKRRAASLDLALALMPPRAQAQKNLEIDRGTHQGMLAGMTREEAYQQAVEQEPLHEPPRETRKPMTSMDQWVKDMDDAIYKVLTHVPEDRQLDVLTRVAGQRFWRYTKEPVTITPVEPPEDNY